MENPEIKACPFCGGPAEVRPREDYYDFRVFCKDDKCGCSSPARGHTFEQAQEWWNRRAGDRQPLMPEVEGVKALASATGSAAHVWLIQYANEDGISHLHQTIFEHEVRTMAKSALEHNAVSLSILRSQNPVPQNVELRGAALK